MSLEDGFLFGGAAASRVEISPPCRIGDVVWVCGSFQPSNGLRRLLFTNRLVFQVQVMSDNLRSLNLSIPSYHHLSFPNSLLCSPRPNFKSEHHSIFQIQSPYQHPKSIPILNSTQMVISEGRSTLKFQSLISNLIQTPYMSSTIYFQTSSIQT